MFGPGDTFALGANLPWVRYGGDFGANLWAPNGGLASSGLPLPLRTAFGRIGAIPGACIRWFLFCDGRAGIRYDVRGDPIGLDARVFPDIDAALAIASACGLRLIFALVDFHWCRPGQVVEGVSLGGRRHIIGRPSGRAALIDRVLAPVLARYGSHPAIAAWDIINEPEWVTRGLGTWHPGRGISRRAMRAFIGETAEAVRAVASQPVTVGSAHRRWLPWLKGLPLDFYQVHWYDRFGTRWPLDRPVQSFNLDKPVVVGELPTRASHHTPEGLLATARAAGYAGAWLWSLHANDSVSDGARALESLAPAPPT